MTEPSIFKEKIEHNSNICNNCYRKLREHNEPHHTMPDCVNDLTEYENSVEFGYFDDFVESGSPNSKEAYCACGAVDWQEFRVRPMDMEDMRDSARRICSHLEKMGFDVDEDKFMSIVNEKGPLPENQCKEDEIFEMATEKSI